MFGPKLNRYKLNSIIDSTKPKAGGQFSLDKKDTIKLVVIAASSTGDGDMPDNGENFFRFLRRKTNLLADG